MIYGKLIDGHLVLAPRSVIVGDRQIGNPTAETLAELGYKAVVYTEPPSVDPGYVAVEGWIEDGGSIVQTWTVEDEPDEIDGERAAELMLGG